MIGVVALLEHPAVYRLWMAPFAAQKLRPLARHTDLGTVTSVLDVGCGPGTNAALFAGTNYLGVDINDAYIADAIRRFGPRFTAGDVTDPATLGTGTFDCIIVNSLLHHLDDPAVMTLLDALADRVTSDGHVHIFELVSPDTPSVARLLARLDRGHFARRVDAWRALVARRFDIVVEEPYDVTAAGVTLWKMLYLKGRRR